MTEPQSTTDAIRDQWGQAATVSPQGDQDLLSYLRPLLSKWRLIAPLAVIGAAAGLSYSYYVHPRYRATCRYEIVENEMLKINDHSMRRPTAYYMYNVNPLERHVLLLNSRNLNSRVRDKLAKKWTIGDGAPGPVLTVSPVEQAAHAMVDIRVDSHDPKYSKAYISELLAGYEELRGNEIKLVHQDTVQNLRAEQRKLDQQLETARGELEKFEAKYSIRFEESKSESDFEHMRNILRKGRAIQTQYTILESQFPSLDQANAATLRDVLDLTMYSTTAASRNGDNGADTLPSWSEMPEWQATEGELVRLQAEYRHLRSTFKPSHPKMVALQEKIALAKEKQKIAASLTLKRLAARRDALRMQEKALENAAKRIEAGLNLTAAERAKHENLKSRVEHLKSLHDRVFARIIDSSSTPQERYFSRTVEGPFASDNPVWPVKWRMVVTGMMGAGGLGVVIAYLLFFRAVRLYNLDLLEQTFNLKSVGAVPRIADDTLQGNPIGLNKLHRADPTCEVYRGIRTAIEENMDGGTLLLFTSPEQSDGKTFTSTNVALASTWTKQRVLLVEGDLRKPALAKQFGISRGQGLVHCLADQSLSWRDCIKPAIAENLDFLPAGKATEHGAELLQVGHAETIFNELKSAYDIVIIDSAPVNRVIDTQILSRYADAVIVVVRPGKTSFSAVRHTMHRLMTANVVGYVANWVTASNQWYYSEYGTSGYYYRAYSGYYGETSR